MRARLILLGAQTVALGLTVSFLMVPASALLLAWTTGSEIRGAPSRRLSAPKSAARPAMPACSRPMDRAQDSSARSAARGLLVYAFASDVIAEIPAKPLRLALQRLVQARLPESMREELT